jgi:hypothetical protein
VNLTQALQFGMVVLSVLALAAYALWQDRREYQRYLKEQEERYRARRSFQPIDETIQETVERVYAR